jgi:hypothetical protein
MYIWAYIIEDVYLRHHRVKSPIMGRVDWTCESWRVSYLLAVTNLLVLSDLNIVCLFLSIR